MIPPSKKILIGCCLIAASLIARVFVAVIAWRTIGEVTAAMNSASGLPDANHALDGIQGHPTLMYGSVAAGVMLLAAGIIFVLIGVYQNAKATEGAS